MEANNISKDGKLAAIIAHLTFLGPVIAWFINQEEKDKFGSFYIKQSVGIFLLFLLISAILPIVPEIMFMPTLIGFYVFIFILWIYSFSGAVSNEYRSEEHTSELQSRENLVCRLLLEKKNKKNNNIQDYNTIMF